MTQETIVWIYVLLLIAGGFIGFFKGKSRISLITSGISAALLILTLVHGLFTPTMARGMSNVIMAALVVVFTIRLAKTKKFMPSGLMLVVTVLALFVRNI